MRSRLTGGILALAAFAAPLAAQSPPPLDKTELIRLLTNPLFAQTEVADVVRRSCLTFRPTERDWADLRNAGASGEVMATAAACDGRRAGNSSAPSPSDETVQPITAVAQPTSVRSAKPGRIRVTPDYVAFRSGDTSAAIVAVVTDSLGNPVPGEPVDLTGGIGEGGSPTSVTDSAGRASFGVTPNSVPRGGSVQLRARGLAPVEVEIAAPAGLSGVNTGFLPLQSTSGAVGSRLGEPAVFSTRTVQGAPAVGRTVRFRTLNARVTPESAVVDSTGRVRVDVSLGTRAGESAVFASVDSVERVLTLRAQPGPIDTLILDRNGEVVNGRSVTVPVATPFSLRLRARDIYGNLTSIDALGQALRAGRSRLNVRQQDLQLVSIESTDSAVVVTLKAQRVGSYQFVIGSGITAGVRVDAVVK